jgi:hypothetical protein
LDRGGDGGGQLRTLNNEWINPTWSCHAETLPLFGSSWKRIRINILAFASRLPNGDTLLTDAGNARIVEVDTNDVPVWQYQIDTNSPSVAAPLPTRAVRLRNGDTLISDQFNNRVILVNHAGDLLVSYGLPLAGGPVDPFPFGNNFGYGLHSSQQGLYSPYDAKVVGDYTGLTPPFDFDGDADDWAP